MENIIVFVIVGVASAWGAFRLLRKRKPASCASGCGGCSCPSKPTHSQTNSQGHSLVTLRR